LGTRIKPHELEGTWTIDQLVRWILENERSREFIRQRMESLTNDELVYDYEPPPGMTIVNNENVSVLEQPVIELRVTKRATPVTYAVGRLGEAEVIHGMSSDTSQELIMVYTKHGPGRLLDANGVRALSPVRFAG
jgi:hypothetical protein